jgi:hypothetical protein
MRLLGLDLPVVWYEMTQRIKIVTPGEIERKKNEHGFQGFLRRSLRQPTDMARHDNALLK